MEVQTKLPFASDYMKGTHPRILARLHETNLTATEGYGRDAVCDAARGNIRKACDAPDALVEFLVGGTQTNAVVIHALLRAWQGVIAAETGHVSQHEAGAIEAGGHKVLTLPHTLGKLSADTVRAYLRDFENDENHAHMVMPGIVYISHPTEYGTLYTKAELEALHALCAEYHIPLYLDGARLAYALACEESDVTLRDLAATCDAFYIGGTKCGALFGEAVVIPDASKAPHFFTLMKQHGALLAKGRMLGLQFEELFRDGLYLEIGKTAIRTADRIRDALKEKGYRLLFDTPTNQIFVVMENGQLEQFGASVAYGFWEKYDDTHTVIRLATDWATEEEDVRRLISLL